MLIHQDIRWCISVFGKLTAFKKIDDIVRIGVELQLLRCSGKSC